MYKNIIYIQGNDSYWVEWEIARWISVFTEKYGIINVERYRLEDKNTFPLIRDTLFTTGLFAEKRLFIFSGGNETKSKKWGFEEILETYGKDIPESHFCLFHNISSKEDGVKNWLIKHADVRTMDEVWKKEVWKKRFQNIDDTLIEQVLNTYKKWELLKETWMENSNISHMIAWSLYMLRALEEEWIDKKDALRETLENIPTWWRIFDLVDAITETNVKKSLKIWRAIIENTKATEILPSLIGLMRNGMYIKYCDAKNISGNLWKIHPFVVKKTRWSPISWETLSQFYKKLIDINIAYKSGNGLKDPELWRIFQIELALLGLKK